jgi:TP901 family phage tail tape measure protein
VATQAGVAYVTVQYDPASVQRLRATTEAEGQRMASRWSGFASRASGLLVRGAGVAVAVGLYKAVSAAADFQKQLNVLQAVSGATASQMHKISDEAIRLGADVKLPATSAQDAAVAMTELAKGGLSVRDSMAAARGTLELAAAGQIDVGDAAQVTANTLNQFALRGTDAAHVADLLAGAANASSGDVSDFAASLVYAGTASHAAGQSVDLTVAALAEMANAGIQGSIAGTSLANAMRSLQAPTAKARDELHKLGIDVYDAHGKMLPLDKLADTFTKHLHGLTQQQQNAALATLFGTRSVQAARAVLLQGGDALDKYRDKVSKQGNAQRLAEAQTKGFRGALQGLESTAETLGIQIGLKLLPPLTTFTRDLTSALPGAVSTATSAVEAFGPPVGSSPITSGRSSRSSSGQSPRSRR